MSLRALVPERADDVERLAAVREAFAFAPRERPRWSAPPERPRAVARLLAFVAAVGLGTGLALWMLGALVVEVVRGTF